MPDPYAYASFHVEHVEKEYAVGAEPEAESQEPEGQYEGADQDQEFGTDSTDCFSQQGKPRFIWKPNVTTISSSLTITTITYALSL